jgi:hypothetical protein
MNGSLLTGMPPVEPCCEWYAGSAAAVASWRMLNIWRGKRGQLGENGQHPSSLPRDFLHRGAARRSVAAGARDLAVHAVRQPGGPKIILCIVGTKSLSRTLALPTPSRSPQTLPENIANLRSRMRHIASSHPNVTSTDARMHSQEAEGKERTPEAL